ncbi:MAG TPA: hypothetical protein VHX61_12425 [Rhizomicrobium sp.]|jgi:hypothetical protein|nr:hypothetical protein [Rhizomicrobium sp.]
MMRFNVVLAALLLVTTAVMARSLRLDKGMPPSQGPVLLDLNSLHLHLFHQQDSAESSPATGSAAGADKDWSQQSGLPPLSMGPLRAHFGEDDNPWGNLSAYQSQLGSSAWEDEQNKSRSAKLLFVWPTDK